MSKMILTTAWYIYVMVMFVAMLFDLESFLDFILLCCVTFIMLILPEILSNEQ